MAEDKKIIGLNRNVFFMGLVSLFNDFSNEMIQSVMPVFLSVTLGVSPVFIGMIEGVADAIASFLKIFSGWLSDKLGKRKSIALIGYALSVSVRPFYGFASTFGAVVGLRITDRVGKGLRDAPRDALISESSEKKDLGKSFGYHRALDAVGGIAGPLAAVLLLPILGGNYKILFFIAFGVGLFSLLSFVFIKEVKDHKDIIASKFNLRIFKEYKSFGFFIFSVFIFGMGTLPITLMLLRPIQLGATIAYIPLIYLAYSLTFVLTAMPLGRLSDKVGERVIIPFGFMAAIISYCVLAFTSRIEVTVLAFMLFGVYAAATDGIERALTSKLVCSELLATGQGFLHAAVGISSLLAGVFGGLIWTWFGSAAAFIYGAGFSLIGLIFFLAVSFSLPKKPVC